MQLQCNVDPDSKLRIRKFFEKQDAREYVRAFVAAQLSGNKPEPEEPMPSMFVPMPTKVGKIPEGEPEMPIVPSIKLEITKGQAFDEFGGLTNRTKMCFDFDVFGKRHRFDDITAQQCPTIGKIITAPLPDRLETLVRYNYPIRVCVSQTAPELAFVGLATLEWRNVLYDGSLEGKIEILGLQNEVVGVLNYTMRLCGFDKKKIDFAMFREALDCQLRQEGIDSVESERQFAIDLKNWWKDLKQLIDDKSMIVNTSEIGSGKTSIFNFVTPMTSRDLPTPGHCLRYATLLNNLNAPVNSNILPNWAAAASKCTGERERIHILVSLLRGFGLNAFVVVAKPRCFAVSLSSAAVFFDVRTGKFGKEMPKVNYVSHMYNEELLLANLCPSESLVDWDIKNPLKWKELRAPKATVRAIPTVLACPSEDIDEEQLECKVKLLIEQHRQSVGLKTKWNTVFPALMLPIADSYEHEKITGHTLGVHGMAAEAMRKVIRPFHAIRAAPASTNSANPGAIFKALTSTRSGLEILGSREDDCSFILIVKCKQYPGGVVSVWALLATDSITPLSKTKRESE